MVGRLTRLAHSKTVATVRVLPFAIALSSGQAFGQDCAPVFSKFRQTSVRIRVEGVNRDTGAVTESHGSGVIVSDRGHVLTNYHVIDLGTDFIDKVYGGSIGGGSAPLMPMRLIDVDSTPDLALLQFNNTARSIRQHRLGRSKPPALVRLSVASDTHSTSSFDQ
jgi:S1-C subfamily serine protease